MFGVTQDCDASDRPDALRMGEMHCDASFAPDVRDEYLAFRHLQVRSIRGTIFAKQTLFKKIVAGVASG